MILQPTEKNLKKLRLYKKKTSKTKSPGKNKKLPNKRNGIVGRIINYFEKGRSFSNRPEKLLQRIFSLLAVEPSFSLNPIQQTDLSLAGDGTSIHCHSSYYGSSVCNCRENAIYDCKCARKLSALKMILLDC